MLKKITGKAIAQGRKGEILARKLKRATPELHPFPVVGVSSGRGKARADERTKANVEKSISERTREDWGETSKKEMEDRIANFRGTVTLQVTPTIARFLLSYNTENRKLRPSRVAEFADLYRRGKHQNTGEPIIMSKEGILNNGQHRLEGVSESGCTVEMDVRFGIERKAFQVTDTHSKRLAGDVLNISGEASVFAVAAAAKMLLAYERGLPGAYWLKVQNDEIADAVERWPGLQDAVMLAQRCLRSRRGFINAATNAFTYLAILQAGEEAVEEFLKLVQTGITKSETNPARLLRERLLNDAIIRSGTRDVVIERMALFIKAWNAWRDGPLITRLTWKGGAKGSERFPIMKGVTL